MLEIACTFAFQFLEVNGARNRSLSSFLRLQAFSFTTKRERQVRVFHLCHIHFLCDQIVDSPLSLSLDVTRRDRRRSRSRDRNRDRSREKRRSRSPRDRSPRDRSPRDRSPRDRSPRRSRSPRDRSPDDRSPRDRGSPGDRSPRERSGERSPSRYVGCLELHPSVDFCL